MTEQVLIGLGSNLSSPVQQIKTVIKNIQKIPSVVLLKQSSLYESSPQGPKDQANFINCVILLECSLSAKALLLSLQELEQRQGRIKKQHWGERTIDLDILFYGQQNVDLVDPCLIIPHPQALLRDFVVLPALEITPEWSLPDGSLLKNYIDQDQTHLIQRIDPNTY